MKILSGLRSTLFILVIALIPLLAAGGENDKILGQWYTGDKGAIVEIYECMGKLCGKIVWIKEPNDPETGKPKVDKNNPNPKLRTRPALGLNILEGFVKEDDDEWEDGTIYDPKNGKTYSCNLTLDGNKLEVRGFVGVSLFGRTENWTRK